MSSFIIIPEVETRRTILLMSIAQTIVASRAGHNLLGDHRIAGADRPPVRDEDTGHGRHRHG